MPASVSLLKYMAKTAAPKIRPYKTTDGREYYVCFAGSANFTQMKLAMNQTGMPAMPAVIGINVHARPRDVDSNPLFQDGDLMYDGVIIREVPEIDNFVTSPWLLHNVGAATSRVAPVFLCGQQAVMFAWGKMATPTFRDETDYQFVKRRRCEDVLRDRQDVPHPAGGSAPRCRHQEGADRHGHGVLLGHPADLTLATGRRRSCRRLFRLEDKS